MKITRLPRFFLGLAVGVLFSVTAAYAINADNTPDNGYLLCVNTKTKAVTYPGVLKCPSGSKALEMGAQGIEGPTDATGLYGSPGPAGPAGVATSSPDVKAMGILTLGTIDSHDMAVAANSVSRRIILAAFTDKTFEQKTGAYHLTTILSGSWAIPATSFNSGEISCYFQDSAVYDATPANTTAKGTVYQGGSRANNDGSWNFSMQLTSTFALSKSPPLVLACWTNASVIGLRGQVIATWYPTGSDLFPIPISQVQ